MWKARCRELTLLILLVPVVPRSGIGQEPETLLGETWSLPPHGALRAELRASRTM